MWFFFFKINLFNLLILFIYLFRLCWVFAAARGLSLVAASRGYSSCSAQARLIAVASIVAKHGL